MNLEDHSRIPIRVTNLWRCGEDSKVTIISDAEFRIRIFKINAVGSEIWKLCDGIRNEEDIATILQDSFDNRPTFEVIKSDVSKFLNYLRDQWLVLWKTELEAEGLR